MVLKSPWTHEVERTLRATLGLLISEVPAKSYLGRASMSGNWKVSLDNPAINAELRDLLQKSFKSLTDLNVRFHSLSPEELQEHGELTQLQDEFREGKGVWAVYVGSKINRVIEEYANSFGVTYDQLMVACAYVVGMNKSAPYPETGTKTGSEVKNVEVETGLWDLWGEWADETGHKFENYGTDCCPEYKHPECGLFDV